MWMFLSSGSLLFSGDIYVIITFSLFYQKKSVKYIQN